MLHTLFVGMGQELGASAVQIDGDYAKYPAKSIHYRYAILKLVLDHHIYLILLNGISINVNPREKFRIN